ncbi:MAG TPA: prepilin peptidase, partial [Mycobacteriales bacterium]|nr:prepilin peptidase [Mycobacteriales bacterium]
MALAAAGIAFFPALAIGSFLNVVAARVPLKRSVVSPASACMECGTEIAWYDNIPVVSWLLLRGRCRGCGIRISPIYPLTELATAGLFASASLAFEGVWVAVVVAAFLAVLVAVTEIDVRDRIIPNRIVYPAVVVGMATVVVADRAGEGLSAIHGVIGMAAFGGGFLLIALVSPKGMGMGDVKLAG